MRSLKHVVGLILVGAGPVLAGCSEEVPRPSAQPSAAAPASAPPAESTRSTGGGTAGQGGGSALAGAKRAANNIVDQAEQASQRTAEQADPDQEREPSSPAEEP